MGVAEYTYFIKHMSVLCISGTGLGNKCVVYGLG
jgi:hypothetical protein